MLIHKTAPPPAMFPRALQPPRPTSPWALQWRGHDQSLHNLMHFRYYASSMGRFLKPDNLIGNMANPQSWNLYSYVNGNPVNFNDPGGHFINPPHSTEFSYIGLGYFPYFLATPEESYWHFRNTLGYSCAASAFFSGMRGLTSTTNAVLDAAGVSGAHVAYKNWVSDALVSGFNFDTETLFYLKLASDFSVRYGQEIGFYFQITDSGDLAVIFIFGGNKVQIPANTMWLSESERNFFKRTIGFDWNEFFIYGHTHPQESDRYGFGVSVGDVGFYRCMPPQSMGFVFQQNKEGSYVLMYVGFYYLNQPPFRQIWILPEEDK